MISRKIIFFQLLYSIFFSTTLLTNPQEPFVNSHYDDSFKEIGHDQQTCVIITAYNRPQYFSQCLKSIEANPESQTLTFIFALDGGPHAKQQENIELIQASTIKHKIILKRNRNYGCPKNHIDSKRFAFDWCKFKKAIILEEDLLITPSYFSLILNFHTWATNQYDNIGATQGWAKCYLTVSQKNKKIDCVRENPDYWSFITYCLDNICWNKIKKYLYKFEEFIDQIPHGVEFNKERSKPYHWDGMPKIRQWVQNTVKDKTKRKNILHSKLYLTPKFLSPEFKATQDIMMGFAFYMNDLVKLQTVVNRVIHIGEIGITATPEKHNIVYKPMKLLITDVDKKLTTFKLIK